MDKVIKQKWVAGLREGYKKTTSVLVRNYGSGPSFCALGVLLETSGLAWRDKTTFWSLEDSSELSDSNSYPTEKFLEKVGLEVSVAYKIAVMNDDRHTFCNIADYIEKNL